VNTKACLKAPGSTMLLILTGVRSGRLNLERRKNMLAKSPEQEVDRAHLTDLVRKALDRSELQITDQ
jgi:hypothetical protein